MSSRWSYVQKLFMYTKEKKFLDLLIFQVCDNYRGHVDCVLNFGFDRRHVASARNEQNR